MKLNLGCGNDYKEGYINADINEKEKIDIKLDINKFPYHFQDDTFDEILMLNVLEYAEKPFKVMEEIFRISKYGTIVIINVPYKNMNTEYPHVNKFGMDFPEYLKKYPNRNYCNVSFRVKSIKLIPTPIGKYIPFRNYLSNFIGNLVCRIEYKFECEK